MQAEKRTDDRQQEKGLHVPAVDQVRFDVWNRDIPKRLDPAGITLVEIASGVLWLYSAFSPVIALFGHDSHLLFRMRRI
jgi:hypothetical protein